MYKVLHNVIRSLKAHPVLLLIVTGHTPFLTVYYMELWRKNPEFHFVPFALAATLGFLATRHQYGEFRFGLVCRALVGLDVILVALGILIVSPWLIAVGLLCTTFAICRACFDPVNGRSLAFVALLPAITVRLPLSGGEQLSERLQGSTTRVASMLLDNWGYLHRRLGNVIELPDRRFLVEEACSGVQSLFTLFFLAGFLCVLNRRRLLHTIFVLGCAIGFAGFMNMLRVLAVTVAWADSKIDISSGWEHDAVGYLALTIAGILVYSADQLTAAFTDYIPDLPRLGPVQTLSNPLIALWNRITGSYRTVNVTPRDHAAMATPRVAWNLPVVGVAGIASIVACGIQSYSLRDDVKLALEPVVTSTLTVLDRDSLPATIGDFERAKYEEEERDRESVQGQYSNTWTYTSGSSSFLASCDHPFIGWHELEHCYELTGWQILRRSVIETDDSDWPIRRIDLIMEGSGERGLLLYSLFDADGRPVSPPDLQHPGAALIDRMFRARHTRLTAVSATTYQSQVFHASPMPIPETGIQSLLDVHEFLRMEMRDGVLTAKNEQPQ